MNIVAHPEEVQHWLSHFEEPQGQAAISPLAQWRKAALEEFAKTGFPTTKHEEWKYTSVRPISTAKLVPAYLPAQHQLSKEWIAAALPTGLDAQTIVLVDGHFDPALSSLQPEPGIEITSLKELIGEGNTHPGDFIHLTTAVESPFVALNTAFVSDGIIIRVVPNAAITRPICIVHVSAQPSETAAHSRTLLQLGENASLTIFETWTTPQSGTALNNHVSEFTLAPNSRLNHYAVQNATGLLHIGFTQVTQAQSSSYNSFVLSTDGALIRNNHHVRHEGQHCETHLSGLYLLDQTAHVDNHTLVDHAQPNCYSNELYKGVLSGKSTAVFNGKVIVRPHAQKTNAFQSNKTVLLSQGARINTKPQLEIFADDVKCSHGATTGRLDENALFYLRSRGLPQSEAMALLTFAFAAEVIEKAPQGPIRDFLKATAEARLATMAS